MAAPGGDLATEGTTALPVVGENLAGPASHDRDQPFHNPAMALNRDLSVLLVDAYGASRGRQIDVADALAGAGARSLRLANECKADIVVHANDGDPNGIAAIEVGRQANKIPQARLQAARGNAHAFLAARRFDVVDIDPFGSPSPFLDAAVRATRHNGLVCVTATDTAALAGTYPRVCRRRYGAEPAGQGTPWAREAGLRILAGAVVRSAGRFDRAAIPVLSVAQDHWMRVVCKVKDQRGGSSVANRLGWAWHDSDVPVTSGRPRPEAAGPLWLGPLHEASILAAMQDLTADTSKAGRLLGALADEADAPPFHVDPGALQRHFGEPMPRRDIFIKALIAAGHGAARTHLDPQGIRTDASLEEIGKVWDALHANP